MISIQGQERLRAVYNSILKSSPPIGERFQVDQSLLAGSLEAAFHIGQIAALARVNDKMQELSHEKAREPDGGLGRNWSAGYLEAGTDLMAKMIEDVDSLKAHLKDKASLSELAGMLGIDP